MNLKLRGSSSFRLVHCWGPKKPWDIQFGRDWKILSIYFLSKSCSILRIFRSDVVARRYGVNCVETKAHFLSSV
jgi:hypothetical protein